MLSRVCNEYHELAQRLIKEGNVFSRETSTLCMRFVFLGVLLAALGLLSTRSARSLNVGVRTQKPEPPISSQQTSQETSGRPRIMEVAPTNAAPEEANSEQRLARQIKSHRYNWPRAEPLVVQEGDEIYGRIEERPPLDPIPISASDAIVVGKVLKVQPYLTELQTSIYTEFTVQVDEVIKSDSDIAKASKKPIVVDREGGVLRQSDGKILRYWVVGIGQFPNLGKKYLLFLNRIHESQDISILAGYELNGNSILPLEDSSASSPYARLNEQEFLNVVRLKVAEFTK